MINGFMHVRLLLFFLKWKTQELLIIVIIWAEKSSVRLKSKKDLSYIA